MNENYPLFVHWSDSLDWILDSVEKFPKSVRFTLSGRIANLALDIIENIAEAIYSKNRGAVLDRINLNLEKLRVLFRISHKRKYISTTQYRHVSELLETAGKMAGGWKKSS